MRSSALISLVALITGCGVEPAAPPSPTPTERTTSAAEDSPADEGPEPEEAPPAPAPAPPFEIACVEGRCQEHPPPGSETDARRQPLYGVSGCAPDDLWAVGEGGIVLHFDGEAWSRERDIGRQARLRNVWCRRPDDVHVFTESRRLFRWDGDSWTRHEMNVPSGSYFESFSFRSAEDAWGVSNTAVVHFDGTEWARVPFDAEAFEPRQVWARADGEVYVFTRQGPVLRWDGASWNPGSRPTEVEPEALCGDRDIEHALHQRGPLTAYCGGEWQTTTLAAANPTASLYLGDARTLLSDWESGLYEVRRGVARTLREPIGDSTHQLYDMHAAGDGTVVVVGMEETILRLRPRSAR